MERAIVGKQGNTHPVVLVYGFMGFDTDSFVRLPYWGGTVDLERELRERGYTVYTACIGPVSSNRDRACELFAAIKGGRVDYGAAHAAEYGHSRYGRTYEGLYPEWGTPDPKTGEIRKVHLVGHSMGGQTSRLLVTLLEEGEERERRISSDMNGTGDEAVSGLSPLFEGGRRWVSSVTSISTPHDGTTITYQRRQAGFIRRLFAKWLAVGSVKKEDPLIDLQLSHWETAKEEGESFTGFLRRAVDEELWKELEDFSYHDLSPRGAKSLNARCPASEHTYYFSWATSTTEPDPDTGYHEPVRSTNLPLNSNARFIGSFEDLSEGVPGPPSLWWENDGVVNTCSMDGPRAGSGDTIVPFDRTPERGVWNFMGKLHPCDHWKIHIETPITRHPPPGYDSLLDFYRAHCDMLWSLRDECEETAKER